MTAKVWTLIYEPRQGPALHLGEFARLRDAQVKARDFAATLRTVPADSPWTAEDGVHARDLGEQGRFEITGVDQDEPPEAERPSKPARGAKS